MTNYVNRNDFGEIVSIDEKGALRFHDERGNLHREDGPAVLFADGRQHWYQNGCLHREDGPAFEFVSGKRMWYLQGRRIK